MMVIIASQAADRREGGGAIGAKRLPSRDEGLPRRAAAAAASHSHRERFGAILAHTVVPVRRTVRATIVRAGRTQPGSPLNHDKSVRMNFCESFTASRNRIPGSTRVHDANQPSHVRCPFTHVSRSIFAGELHLHLTIGASACLTRGGSNPTRNRASV